MNKTTLVLGEVLAQAAAQLKEAGTPEPSQESLRLWTGITGRSLAESVLQKMLPVSESEATRFAAAVSRRAAREPLAYVTGWTGFRRLVLRCDRRALIPRPETEGLVELVLSRTTTGRVLDVGTGSGCIALSLAQEGRYGAVIAIDCSAGALTLARENAALTGLPVHFVRGDLCSPIGAGRFDVVVANLPYLTETEYAGLDPSVRDWEPAVALASGPDGLEATRRILREGRDVVGPGGWLALEVDCTRAGPAAREAEALGWSDVSVRDDLFGRARYLMARRREWN